jgi:hypothetical protein
MSWTGKSFGQQEDDRAAALAEVGAKFDEAKKNLMSIVVEALSDADMSERRYIADLLGKDVLPALRVDPNPMSRALSIKTLQRLIAELRPPKNATEMSHLDSAITFHVLRRLAIHASAIRSPGTTTFASSNTSALTEVQTTSNTRLLQCGGMLDGSQWLKQGPIPA